MGDRLDEGVAFWLGNQVVDAEAAPDDIEEQLVEFRGNLKQCLVVGLA